MTLYLKYMLASIASIVVSVVLAHTCTLQQGAIITSMIIAIMGLFIYADLPHAE